MEGRKTLTIIQMNDSHAYFDLHQDRSERIIDAMQKYLAAHRSVHAELRGTFVAV
jgi:hypothetical protein